MGDDELILGHRASEWCSHAPILEEDIAFANLALDEIGHAALWYGALAELLGEDPDRYPDRLVFFRQPAQFRSAQLVELSNGDWAFTILRQYLFDAAELAGLEQLKESRYAPLAQRAAKIWKEEIYHHRHTQAWATRLALGTEESHRRMQNALDLAWPYTAQLFSSLPGEEALAEAGFCPPFEAIRAAWSEEVLPFLGKCELILPDVPSEQIPRDRHMDHFKDLIAEMQSVAREEPEAEW